MKQTSLSDQTTAFFGMRIKRNFLTILILPKADLGGKSASEAFREQGWLHRKHYNHRNTKNEADRDHYYVQPLRHDAMPKTTMEGVAYQ